MHIFAQSNVISNEGKLIIAEHSNMDESHRCHDRQKKPFTTEFRLGGSIYLNTTKPIRSQDSDYFYDGSAVRVGGGVRRAHVVMIRKVCLIYEKSLGCILMTWSFFLYVYYRHTHKKK